VPCGKSLAKWNKSINEQCLFCNQLETTEHLIYDCERSKTVWNHISSVLQYDIKYKQIICGFPNFNESEKIKVFNIIISITSYAIFKLNSKAKYDNFHYSVQKLCKYVKGALLNFMYIQKHYLKKNRLLYKLLDLCQNRL
jgi:hypothetical protein